ncbi:Gfo/Idh/MocA family oxidoreductase [Pelagibacteraceae bacterium]|nr:Gfo/Idh/MocA family oxidoreductase [Pelagibacteraceae bacterium]
MNILIIGVGQIGSRHLEAISKIKKKKNIYLIEPNQDSINTALELYKAVKKNNLDNIETFNQLSELKKNINIDFCIIATAADVRYLNFERLLEVVSIKHIIFEKVLFQSLNHYEIVKQKLFDNNIKGWVNCVRRYYQLYKDLKEFIKPNMPIEMNIFGDTDNGMACNIIHYIDLMNFLSQSFISTINTSGIDKEILPAKREGFIEFSGKTVCNFSDGSRLSFSSLRNKSLENIVTIKQNGLEFIYNEANGITKISNNGSFHESVNLMPYQSELTNLVIEDLFQSNTCKLVDYNTSVRLHVPIIRGLLKFYNSTLKKNVLKLPIT